MKDSIAISVLLLTFRSFLSSEGVSGDQLHFLYSASAGLSIPWQFITLTVFYSATGYFLFRCFYWSGDFWLRLGFFASLFFLLEIILLWVTPVSWNAIMIFCWLEKVFFGAAVFMFATYRQRGKHLVIRDAGIKYTKTPNCQQADRLP